jgi:hypothetical protein
MSGRYFEVAVWQTAEPDTFECFIRCMPGAPVSVYKGVIECGLEQLRELESFTKLAQLLIEHLREHKPFEKWMGGPGLN